MAATANIAAASAIPDHPLSVNRLFLPEHMRFDGKRLNQFKVHFGLLLSSLNIESTLTSSPLPMLYLLVMAAYSTRSSTPMSTRMPRL